MIDGENVSIKFKNSLFQSLIQRKKKLKNAILFFNSFTDGLPEVLLIKLKDQSAISETYLVHEYLFVFWNLNYQNEQIEHFHDSVSFVIRVVYPCLKPDTGIYVFFFFYF